jgi:electron transfer flavoprotein alpha subunit
VITENYGPVWVIAQQAKGEVQAVSLQLIGRARKLADELGVSVGVILMGDQIQDLAPRLFAAGADTVYLGDAPQLANYQPELYMEMIDRLAEEKQPEIMLLGSTFMGRELAPLVAARLKTGLTAHCIELVLGDNKHLVAKVPAYGGLLSIICKEKRPQMATAARGVFPMPEFDESRHGEVVALDVPDMACKVETLEIIREEVDGIQLETAPVVVVGGAGAGNDAGWGQIEALALSLNAALGSTRPAVDEGWIELDTMIGQSGKMVSPKLYIGVGLSGELQHMVGVVGAQVMVAINNDPKAPVFEQVDYGIVDDCQELVPVLIEKIKEYRLKN